jgi:hypothetical protein
MKLRLAPLPLLLPALVACLSPPPPSERATDAARDLNLAARFGRMDLAAAHAADSVRGDFMKRREGWGKTVRILDTEMAGFEMADASSATVMVDVSWVRMDETTVRSTRVSQAWRDETHGGWKLVREKRVAGDLGLFGEYVEMRPRQAKDVHFPVKVITE